MRATAPASGRATKAPACPDRRFNVDEAIGSVGHRDVCPLEAGSSVGRAGNDNAILIEDLDDRPRLEHRLALRRQAVEESYPVLAGGPVLDDERPIVVDPDDSFTRRPLDLNWCSLLRHDSTSSGSRMLDGAIFRQGRTAACDGPLGPADPARAPEVMPRDRLARNQLPPPLLPLLPPPPLRMRAI